SDYQALGDPAGGHSPLENAVKQAADGVLQAERPDESSLMALREAFVPAMVRVSEQGSYARRAAWEKLPEAARPLLEALVAARLLVRRQDEEQGRTVEVAHEALLRVWPLLRSWLDDSREFLLGSQQLEQDLAQWKTAKPDDKPKALLTGLKLAKGRAWLAERGNQMGPELRAFIGASHKRFMRQRRILLCSAVGVFTTISCAAGLAYWQAQRADAEAIKATQQATRLRGILLLLGNGSLARARLAEINIQPTKPLDLRSLKLIMPTLPKEKAEIFLPYLQVLMNMFEINTPARQAAFLAAIASETGDLKYLQEIGNGMIYENRRDMGNIYPGDGPRFKGRGAFQFVGRANYERLGRLIDIDLVSNPEQLASSQEIALLVAAVFWHMNGLNEKVDNGNMSFIKLMLGSLNGSFERYYSHAIGALSTQ
ncbi:MAG: glycoside hydrolase family 19 protein, partial [Burkholderiaceae bacterium]